MACHRSFSVLTIYDTHAVKIKVNVSISERGAVCKPVVR